MATGTPSWTACGSSSDGTYLYYGKTQIVTGNPLSGTGWTLYSGATLANTANSASIPGLDDNVEYTFYVYCHCVASGNGPLSNFGPIINYVCPTISSTTPTSNGLSYTLNVPASANNTGSWIQNITVSVYDSGGISLLYTNIHNAPFVSPISGNFTGLVAGTNYQLKISYSNAGATRTSTCSTTNFTTAAACVAPTVTLNNATSNSFDVLWSPSTGGTFDILVNSNVIASGLVSSPYTVTSLNPATIYQVNVRKNCSTGGNAVSSTQSITTTNANINGIISINSSQPQTSGTIGTYTMSFSFPTATTFPITVYFGQVAHVQNSSNAYCNLYNGYDLFSPNIGPNPQCFSASGLGYGGYGPSDNLPWVINIPQGVTNYSTAANSIYTTAGSVNGSSTYTPWSRPGGSVGLISGITDIFIRVNSPSGYSANFTIVDGLNETGIVIHNT